MPEGAPLLLSGAITTLEIALLSAPLAFILATLAGLARLSRHRILRWPADIYVELFRGTALLIQLFWMYFVLPDFGLSLPAFTVAVLALGLNYGAYGAEIVRGAILAVPRTQREAAAALGLHPRQTFAKIILPQAAVLLLLPWGTLMIQLVKATSLVSLITIAELSYRAYQLNQVTLQTAPIFGLVLILYFAMTQSVALLTRWIDRSVGQWRTP